MRRKRGPVRRSFRSGEAERVGVQGTRRGRARHGLARGDTLSPAGLCARPSGLPAPGSGAAGRRVRVPAPRRLGSRRVLPQFAVREQVSGRCSRSRHSGRAGSVPPPRARLGVSALCLRRRRGEFGAMAPDRQIAPGGADAVTGSVPPRPGAQIGFSSLCVFLRFCPQCPVLREQVCHLLA